MAPTNRFLPAMQIAARGMEAQRRTLGAATENIANANTSRTEDGDPYAIKRAVHEVGNEEYARLGRGRASPETELRTTEDQHMSGASVRLERGAGNPGPVTEIQEVERERLEYDPSHPHADEDGYVHYPDVNVAQEMSRMISANRVYEANISAVESTKSMVKQTFKI